MNEVRQLTFLELMKLSKILRKIKFKTFVNELLSPEFNKTLVDMKCTEKEKKQNILVKLLAYIIENMDLAQLEIMELIALLDKVTVAEVEKYTINEIIPVLFTIITGGLPKNIITIFDSSDIKKKLMEMLNQ